MATRKKAEKGVDDIIQELKKKIHKLETDCANLAAELEKATAVMIHAMKTLGDYLGGGSKVDSKSYQAAPVKAGVITGACVYTSTCAEITRAQCDRSRGQYQGDGTHCPM